MLGRRVLLVSQFERYRNNGLFIDCIFVKPDGAEIPCHRLVLARNSRFMRELFDSRKGEASLKIPVPFDIDNIFERVIECFYSDKMKFGQDLSVLTEFYALAKIYRCDFLETVLRDLIERTISKDTVLSLTRPFTRMSLDPEMVELYPTLEQSFREMEDSVEIFSKTIAENFETYDINEIYRSVTPRLLAATLKLLDYTSDQRVGIIDNFVKATSLPDMDNRERLQKLIEWDLPESYLLFANHEADWVPPRISRNAISRLISNRRETLKAFQEAAKKDVSKSCVNWYAFSWLSHIRESRVVNVIGDIEITEFLGTLGGCCEEFNPMLYRLLTPYCSLALQVEQFSELLFDREALAEKFSYFLSLPRQPGPLFVGYDFIKPCFVVTSVKLVLQLNKPIPKVVVVRTFIGSQPTYESAPVEVPMQEEVDIPISCPSPIQRVAVEMIGENSVGSRIMRVLALKICGHFTASNSV